MASTIEFDRLVSYFDADISALEKTYARAMKLGDQLQAKWAKIKLMPGGGGSGSGSTDKEMAKAMADIRRMERERASMERSVTRSIERESQIQKRIRLRDYKTSMNQMLADSRRRVQEENRLSARSLSRGSGGGLLPLTGGLLGGLTAAQVAKFFATSAMGIEDNRNKFTALEGSVEKANARMRELLKLSRESVGVNFDDAMAGWGQLKVLGTVGETSINKMIKALGLLQIGFKNSIGSSSEFLLNLQQLFDQGFEAQDWKQAIGRVTIWEQLVERAFGTRDTGKLKEMKANGQLTMDAWIAGIAEAAQTDSRLTGLRETFSTKLTKAFTELKIAAAPVGEAILNQLKPELDRAILGLQQRDYTQIGNAIGGSLGRAIALAMRESMKASEGDGVGWNVFDPSGIQRGLLRGFAEAFNPTGYETPITDFFTSIGNKIRLGSNDLMASLAGVTIAPIADIILEKMGFGPNLGSTTIKAWFENNQREIEKYNKELLDQNRTARLDQATRDIGANTAILNDPASTAQAKARALAGLRDIARALEIEAANIQAEAHADSQQIGVAIGDGIASGVTSKQGDVVAATSGTIPASVPGTAEKGSSIGQNFASGIASGIRSGGGWVGAAVAALIDSAFSSAKAEAEIKSPSERAARELGLPFTEGIAKGVKGAKAKKALKQSLKDLYDDLIRASGQIGASTDRSIEIVERMFGLGLGDHASSYDKQIVNIKRYYDELRKLNDRRLREEIANIDKREAAIKQRKDLKAGEKRAMLLDLGQERNQASDAFRSRYSDIESRRNADINEAAMRRIEQAQRSLARTFIETENQMIGVRRSAEAEAQTNYDNELRRAVDLVSRYTAERDKYAEGSAQYIFWNNKMIDAEEERKDVVVRGSGEIARARETDQEAIKGHLEQIRQFSQQSKEAEFEAEQARIEMLRETGANREIVFAAERALAVNQENFRHNQRQAEIEAQKQSLLALQVTEDQRNQIIAASNAQMEAEARRHQSVITQITNENSRLGIIEQWRRMAAEIPTYQSQFEDFAVGLPNLLGDSFKAGLMNMEEGWNGFWQAAKETFLRSLTEMLAELAKAQLIKGLVGLFGGLLGGIGGGGLAGQDIGGGVNIYGNLIPGRASGGPVMGSRAYMVGEAGPELFVPRTSGRIMSNDDTRSVLGGGSTQPVVIHNHFHANERTGAFSRPSAQQAARDTSDYLQKVARR